MSPPPPAPPPLHSDKHIQYVLSLDKDRSSFEFWATEHLRVSGIYWSLSALFLVHAGDELDRDEIMRYIGSCHASNGGYGGGPSHDGHMLYTTSAVQVAAMYDRMDAIDVEALVRFIAGLQVKEGALAGGFAGDEWGEVDTRFSYCAVLCLAILGRLSAIDVDLAVSYVAKCRNFDGGFGTVPGAESHAGQIFCCVGFLAIVGRTDIIDRDLLSWWLCERQVKGGGLNGRPEKKEDVCYSWWILSCMSILGRLHWIDRDALVRFILDCQDPEAGGISDRPGNCVDVFHTFFGLAGLSLLGVQGLAPIDPVYALPVTVSNRLGLKKAFSL